MVVSSTLWMATIGLFVALFVIDFVFADVRSSHFGHRNALIWVSIYVVAAILFGLGVWAQFGKVYGQQFFAGWITEYSLSVDNLFVFIVLMASFAVPSDSRHRVLLFGVTIALVLRAVLIFIGAAALERFIGTYFLFAGFLFYTAISVWRSKDSEPNPDGNSFVRLVERIAPVTREYDNSAFITRVEGRRMWTPMLLVVIAVGTTDLLFALDSIPAVLGLTQETYLVVAVNAFALMGLRQLFFLLDGLLSKLIFLPRGLSVILGFIAVKLFLEALDAFDIHAPQVSTGASLVVILGVLAVTVVTSLRAVKADPSLIASTEVEHALRDAQTHEGEALKKLGVSAEDSTSS